MTYDPESRKLAAAATLSKNARQRRLDRLRSLEMLLARAYYAMDALNGVYFNPTLMGDIHDALTGKRISSRNRKYCRDAHILPSA